MEEQNQQQTSQLEKQQSNIKMGIPVLVVVIYWTIGIISFFLGIYLMFFSGDIYAPVFGDATFGIPILFFSLIILTAATLTQMRYYKNKKLKTPPNK